MIIYSIYYYYPIESVYVRCVVVAVSYAMVVARDTAAPLELCGFNE